MLVGLDGVRTHERLTQASVDDDSDAADALPSTPGLPAESSERARPAGRHDSAYWRIVAQCARREPSIATKTQYLRDHAEAWQARLALIEQAQSTIANTVYCIEPDDFGLRYLDSLIAARQRGVQVALVLDSIAQRFVYRGADRGKVEALEHKLAQLRAAGATVRHFGGADQQLELLASGMHAKILVVDGKYAITGGRNVGGNYFGHLFADFDMRFEGPIVRQLLDDALTMIDRAPGRGFDERRAWAIARNGFEASSSAHRATRGDEAGRLYHIVTWDPLHDGGSVMREYNRITLALLHTLRRATREITLTSNYVVGHKDLREALVAAAQRGVRVRIVSTGEEASRISKMAYLGTTPGYPELCSAGVEIHETTHTPDHAKVFVIDDVAAFGSYNFSDYADGRLAEMLTFTAAVDDVEFMRRLLNQSIAHGCRRFDPNQPQAKLPFSERLKHWLGRLSYHIRRL